MSTFPLVNFLVDCVCFFWTILRKEAALKTKLDLVTLDPAGTQLTLDLPLARPTQLFLLEGETRLHRASFPNIITSK
jgi:hypothetical protein